MTSTTVPAMSAKTAIASSARSIRRGLTRATSRNSNPSTGPASSPDSTRFAGVYGVLHVGTVLTS